MILILDDAVPGFALKLFKYVYSDSSNNKESLLRRYLSMFVDEKLPNGRFRTTNANVGKDNKATQIVFDPLSLDTAAGELIVYRACKADGFKVGNAAAEDLTPPMNVTKSPTSTGEEGAVQVLYDMTIKLRKRRIWISQVSAISTVSMVILVMQTQ